MLLDEFGHGVFDVITELGIYANMNVTEFGHAVFDVIPPLYDTIFIRQSSISVNVRLNSMSSNIRQTSKMRVYEGD